MLYPQNGDRIVVIDSVTSLYPVYWSLTRVSVTKLIGRRAAVRERKFSSVPFSSQSHWKGTCWDPGLSSVELSSSAANTRVGMHDPELVEQLSSVQFSSLAVNTDWRDTVCNSPPKTVVNSDSVTAFKSRLKTFLFSRAFSLPSSE